MSEKSIPKTGGFLGQIINDYEKFTTLFDNVIPEVDRTIKKLGFKPTPEIVGIPQELMDLPQKISDLTNQENSNLQGNFASVYAYASRMLARARTREQMAERKYRNMRSRIFLSSKGTRDDRLALATTDARSLTLEEDWIRWAAIVRELEATCESIQTNRMTLSRDVELRKTEFQGEQRAHNVQHYRSLRK